MPKIITCPICGTVQRMQDSAKYCSDKCRQKAHRIKVKIRREMWAELDMLAGKPGGK